MLHTGKISYNHFTYLDILISVILLVWSLNYIDDISTFWIQKRHTHTHTHIYISMYICRVHTSANNLISSLFSFFLFKALSLATFSQKLSIHLVCTPKRTKHVYKQRDNTIQPSERTHKSIISAVGHKNCVSFYFPMQVMLYHVRVPVR